MRPFDAARAYVRSLGLTSTTAWRAWSKSGARPEDIPARPERCYHATWAGYADWLGVN